jgi:uncharacterized membrane protein
VVAAGADADGFVHGVVFDRGATTVVGTFGGIQSRASGINDSGTAVGSAETGSPDFVTGMHAMAFRGGELRDLGVLDGATGSEAWDVNDRGDAVGSSCCLDNITSNATLFRANGDVVDLNAAVPPDAGWRVATAFRINNEGLIVGAGFTGDRQHAFLLVPQASS